MDIIHLFLSWEISTIYKWFFGDLNPQIELQTSLFADVAAAQWDIRQEVNIEVYCWYIHLSTYFFRLLWIKYCHFFIYRRYHWSGRVRCNEMGCSKDRFLGSSTDDPAILQVPSKLCFFPMEMKRKQQWIDCSIVDCQSCGRGKIQNVHWCALYLCHLRI